MNDFYVYKNRRIFGKISTNRFYRYLGNGSFSEELDLPITWILEDLLPEGIDLEILRMRNPGLSLCSLLSRLQNCVGDYAFSHNLIEDGLLPRGAHVISDYEFGDDVILNIKNSASASLLDASFTPDWDTKERQEFSLSGYQHKFQAYIKNKELIDGYGDLIVKPNNPRFKNIAINEALHTRFFEKFGLGSVFNGCFFDEDRKAYHYLIKRFDFDEHDCRKELVSLHGLNPFKGKASGSLEEALIVLKDRMSDEEKLKTLTFFFVSSLVFHNDLHKKNVSFFVDDDKSLRLAPPYDIINALYYSPMPTQTSLLVNKKRIKVGISDFKPSCEVLNIDYRIARERFIEAFDVYREEYPKLIDRVFMLENVEDKDNFVRALASSHEYSVDLFEKKINGKANFFESIFKIFKKRNDIDLS